MPRRRPAPPPPLPAPPPVVVPGGIDNDGGKTWEQGRDTAAVVVYVDVSPAVASAVVVINAVFFTVSAVVPVISGGRAPLPNIIVVCFVLRAVVVNGTPAAEPLSVAVIVADVFLRVAGQSRPPEN